MLSHAFGVVNVLFRIRLSPDLLHYTAVRPWASLSSAATDGCYQREVEDDIST